MKFLKFRNKKRGIADEVGKMMDAREDMHPSGTNQSMGTTMQRGGDGRATTDMDPADAYKAAPSDT